MYIQVLGTLLRFILSCTSCHGSVRYYQSIISFNDILHAILTVYTLLATRAAAMDLNDRDMMTGAGAGSDDKRQKEKGRFKVDSIDDLNSSSDAAPQPGSRDCLYPMSSILAVYYSGRVGLDV
ncbi:uncharacterized protein BDW70DRAFT_98626 [Aspergillus foveolatus]|uniref:uncharacterized protein n=1 Tax=Aspergillus foveolatus TaxID=210207 RepID=UPI003CCD954D